MSSIPRGYIKVPPPIILNLACDREEGRFAVEPPGRKGHWDERKPNSIFFPDLDRSMHFPVFHREEEKWFYPKETAKSIDPRGLYMMPYDAEALSELEFNTQGPPRDAERKHWIKLEDPEDLDDTGSLTLSASSLNGRFSNFYQALMDHNLYGVRKEEGRWMAYPKYSALFRKWYFPVRMPRALRGVYEYPELCAQPKLLAPIEKYVDPEEWIDGYIILRPDRDW